MSVLYKIFTVEQFHLSRKICVSCNNNERNDTKTIEYLKKYIF